MNADSAFEESSDGRQSARPDKEKCPVMLALSTFRQSERAVELALQMAAPCKKLIVTYVVDVNLARYLIGTDIGFYPELKEKCEQEILREHEQKGAEKVKAIVARAGQQGIETTVCVRVGRFALVCLDEMGQQKPSAVITTRSRRPSWVKKLFGSPVNYLIAHAGCPVIEA